MRRDDETSPSERRAKLGPDELGESALSRIADHIAVEGPRVVRRARRVRVAVRVGGAALGLALVVWGLNMSMPRTDAPMLASKARACELWSSPAALDLRPGRVELGRRGLASVGEDAELRIVENERCELIVHLERGEIAVHAWDLGGGTLVVQSNLGRVRVLGTLFEVSQRDELFQVKVAEGTVEVEASRERLRLEAGHRLELRGGVVHTQKIEPEVETQLRARVDREASAAVVPRDETDPPEVSPEPVLPRSELATPPRRSSRGSRPERTAKPEALAPAPSAETADELVARAGPLRSKDPELARSLYRRAGAMSGATAEAAWLALARLELRADRNDEALAALEERANRFPRGSLAIEAAGIRLEAYEAKGDRARALVVAKEIVARWPDSQQARRAQALLAEKP